MATVVSGLKSNSFITWQSTKFCISTSVYHICLNPSVKDTNKKLQLTVSLTIATIGPFKPGRKDCDSFQLSVNLSMTFLMFQRLPALTIPLS